jgi:protein-disulfide isomerase
MNVRFLPLPTVIAALALLGPAAARASEAPPDATAASAADQDPAAVLPGVPLEGLTPEQQQAVARWATTDFCACGCPHTVSECLRTHHSCKHAARMVRLAAAVAGAPGATPEAIRGFVRAYYTAFDRRVSLDVKAFGPPLGKADAPLTLVEFSDFTCPFCQQLRPALEAFVAAHPEVKLFFKPFPVEQHLGAVDAATAGEWGRDRGVFWAMHDALFEAPSHDLDDLAAAAERAGGDPSDLREAVTSKRGEARVRASQSEGVKAGVDATPTLFLDGRRLRLPALTPGWLQFAVEDELEWKKRKGWEKD